MMKTQMTNTPSGEQSDFLYFAVVYLKNGNIDLRPAKSQEDAIAALDELLTRGNGMNRAKIKATTVIKRDMRKFSDGYIFGHRKNSDRLMTAARTKH